MSIISSNHRLVKVSYDGDQYSAGPGIVIEDSTISVDPNLSAVIDDKLDTSSFSSYSATIDDELQYVSANAGNTYSAGDNIDIYEQDNDLYISAKDWTTDIANASSYAFNEATAQIPPAFDPTYMSGQIDNKLNKSDFETYSGTVNTQITGLSGEVQTTSSILSAAVDYLSGNAGKTYNGIAPIVVNNTTDEISADTQDITFGTGLDFTNGVLSVTAQGGDPEVESVVKTNSADWGTITAFSSTSSVLNNQVTALRHDLITVITNTGYLYNDLQTTSGILSGAIDYVSSNMPDGFTGVNHDNNLSGDGKSIPLGLASSFQLVDTSIYTTATYGGSVSIEGLMPRLQLKKTNSSYNTIGEGGMTVTHPASSVGGGYTTSHYGEKMSLSYNDGDYYLHSMDTTKSGLGVTYRGAPNVKAYYNYSGVALTNDNGATNEYVNVDSIRNWNDVSTTVQTNSGSWTGGGSTADPSEYSPYFLALSSISANVGSNNTVQFGGWAFGQNVKADNGGVSFGKNVTGGSYSFGCGSFSEAGGGSLAVGIHTEAITSCIAVGNTTKANYYSVAVGNNASAIDYGLAVGLHTSANNCAVAVGYDTSAGKYSQAFGRNVIITNTGMAIGQYNNESANAAFVIGNGTSNNARSDSFIIYHDGSVSAMGKISANGVELGAGGGGGSIDTIPVAVISPLVTGFSGESAYLGIESTALNLSSYVPVSAIGVNSNDHVNIISGKYIQAIVADQASLADQANYANRATYDDNNNEITSYYQPALTIAGDTGTITAINGSAVGASIPEGWELVAGQGIEIVDDSVNNQTTISVTAAGGNPEVESYVQTNSASIDDVVSTYEANSGNYLTAHQSLSDYYTTADANTVSSMFSGAIDYVSANAGTTYTGVAPIVVTGNTISADSFDLNIGSGLAFENNTLYTSGISANEWNSNYDTVNTNSGAWGGQSLSISAGAGIGLSMVDGVLVISVTGGN